MSRRPQLAARLFKHPQMSLLSSIIEVGDLKGICYDFEDVGDILNMHEHTEENIHISIVSRGSFIAKGIGWEIPLILGRIYDWKPYQAHEFIAVEPNSRVINIQKNIKIKERK